MSNRVTEKQLQAIVDRINRMMGTPMATYTKDAEGRYRANVGNYHLDFAYGGVKLAQIASDGGGTHDVLRIGYVTKRELESALFSFIAGIEAKEGAR